MSELFITLRYLLPSVVVFLTAFYLFKAFFENEQKNRHMRMLEEKHKLALPIRMQAYERLVLLLERISPSNLVMRVHQPAMTAPQFQKLLVQAVRDEFDHNLSQQLYISAQAWELIRNAREEMIRQINVSASKLSPDATSTDLSQRLLEMSVEKLATRRALDFLKNEARSIF